MKELGLTQKNISKLFVDGAFKTYIDSANARTTRIYFPISSSKALEELRMMLEKVRGWLYFQQIQDN